MKIGLISDLHGNIHALDRVLEKLDELGVVLTICAGDLVCYGAQDNQVIDRLIERRIPCVMGNYDEAAAWNLPKASHKPSSPANEPLKQAALDWTKKHLTPSSIYFLKSLPVYSIFYLDGLKVGLIHAGLDSRDEEISLGSQTFMDLTLRLGADVIVFGHTHKPVIFKSQETLIINPGAVGRSLNMDPRASYAVLDTKTMEVSFHLQTYDLTSAVQSIKQSGMPKEIACLVQSGARRIEEIQSK